MKQIAIFSSRDGLRALEATTLFSEGNKIRVSLYLTDSEPSAAAASGLPALGVEIVRTDAATFSSDLNTVEATLRDKGIDTIVCDGFLPALPDNNTLGTEFDLITVADGETIQQCVLKATRGSVDAEWARTLHLDYDEETARMNRQVPPPVQPQAPEQAPSATPPQVNPYPQQTPFVSQPNPAPQSTVIPGGEGARRPMPKTYLVWSVLATLFCCFLPGIIGIIFSSQVGTRYYQGDYAGAEKASRNAEIWIIVSFVLGMITSTLYLPLMLIS